MPAQAGGAGGSGQESGRLIVRLHRPSLVGGMVVSALQTLFPAGSSRREAVFHEDEPDLAEV
jgi:hypothetical protein